MVELDLAGAVSELLLALESAGLSYAIGGALALAVWSVPRATRDIDVTLFHPPGELRATLERLLSLGVEGTLARAVGEAEQNGVTYLRWRSIRLDVFVPSIDFYREAERTRVRVELPGMGPAWVLCAESLAVFKLMFFRGKDQLDLEQLARIRGGALDRAYVRQQLVELTGEDDERIHFWDRLPATPVPR